MSTIVPFVPDNAPFTPEQRAWLNGFLAGMFSSAPVGSPAVAPAGKRIAVLYASQSGTAEALARKLAKELKAQGHTPAISTLVGYTPAALAAESHALIIASTYGDGEAPDGVQPFFEQLCLEHFPRMEKLRYAVFALGDRHYEHFCKFGLDLDAKLAALGANPLCARMDCDVDVEASFAQWKSAVLDLLNKREDVIPEKLVKQSSALQATYALTDSKPDKKAPAFTRDNPLMAAVVEKRRLTADSSSKATIHIAFSTSGTGLTYEAGDAFGIIPANDPNLVAEILQRMCMNGNEKVTCGKHGVTTLHGALMRNLQITRLSRKIIQEYAKRGNCSRLLELLSAERAGDLEQYASGRGLVDLLVEFPGVLDDAADVVAMLPKLTPRLYSISSSPAAHPGQLHATVAVVRYHAHQRERSGVCSTLLSDRTSVFDNVPIYIQPNKKFRLPANPDAPMIMIGPGTGIAPFRAFLQERAALGHKGRNWLFFGERSSATDFLYREELEGMLADGRLSRMDTAFSRDQQHKVYVQDRMRENAHTFWRWLQEGSSVYVCGDASRMARDVHAALCEIVQKEGGMSSEHTEEYVASLKEQHRYHRDVY